MTGAIAFKTTGFSGDSRLAWFDRSGRRVADLGPPSDYRNPELSDDGKFVAFERGPTATTDIWIMDMGRAVTTRLTSDPAADRFPIWSSDGKTILFLSEGQRRRGLYLRPWGTVGEDTLLKIPSEDARIDLPYDWTRKGTLAFSRGSDIWAMNMAGNEPPVQVTRTAYAERGAQVSPEGRWIAYASNEVGGTFWEIFIQSFPEGGVKIPVSSGGGAYPRWSHDGTELFYVARDAALMVAKIATKGQSLEIARPVRLFDASQLPFGGDVPNLPIRMQYDVAVDGRFLMNVVGGSGWQERPITVILNWAGAQKRTN